MVKKEAKLNAENPWRVGANYFIRTVTHHFTGNLVSVGEKELVLVDAAWIADDGRFSEAMETETFSEVEPYPAGKKVIIGRSSVIDAVELTNLPRELK